MSAATAQVPAAWEGLRFVLATGATAKSAVAKNKTFTDSGFVRMLTDHKVRAEKDGPWYCAGPMANGHRGDTDAQGGRLAVLDLDHGNYARERVHGALGGFAHVLHATHSSRLGDRRYRAVLALDKEVDEETRVRVTKALAVYASLGGVESAPEAWTKARLWYPPAHPPGGADTYGATRDGKLVPADLFAELGADLSHDPGPDGDGEPAEAPEPERADEARDALQHIDPDEPEPEWVQTLFAIHALLGPKVGKVVAREWSARGTKFEVQQPFDDVWASIHPGKVRAGTLFDKAKAHGWDQEPWNRKRREERAVREPAREAFRDYIKANGPTVKRPDGSDYPTIVPASEVKLANINWLWKPRIAIGELGLVAGEAGIGKSLMAIDIAARVTRGLPLPGEPADPHREPSAVLYLNGEDHPEAQVRARLAAAGADLTRVYILQAGSGQLRLPSDLTWLDAQMIRFKDDVVLAIFDTLGNVLDPGLDPNSAADIRKALNPLGPWGAKHKLSPLVLHHFNKAIEKNGVYRIAGSAQIVGVSRHVLVVSPDPEAEDDSPVRLVGLLKTNSAKAPTYAFEIQEKAIPEVNDPVGFIEWKGAHSASAKSLTEVRRDGRPARERDKAAEWLTDRLSSGDEVPVRLIYEEGRAAGHSERTLRRAAKDLGVKVPALVPARDEQGRVRGSTWALPGASKGAA